MVFAKITLRDVKLFWSIINCLSGIVINRIINMMMVPIWLGLCFARFQRYWFLHFLIAIREGPFLCGKLPLVDNAGVLIVINPSICVDFTMF